jgi:hypothetical protein
MSGAVSLLSFCGFKAFVETTLHSFDVPLTVHLSITLDNDQLDVQITLLIHSLQSSTCICFEQYLAHPREVKLH